MTTRGDSRKSKRPRPKGRSASRTARYTPTLQNIVFSRLSRAASLNFSLTCAGVFDVPSKLFGNLPSLPPVASSATGSDFLTTPQTHREQRVQSRRAKPRAAAVRCLRTASAPKGDRLVTEETKGEHVAGCPAAPVAHDAFAPGTKGNRP